jgi:hypothetical protein
MDIDEQKVHQDTGEELQDRVNKGDKYNGGGDEDILHYKDIRTPETILNGLKHRSVSIDDENARHIVIENVGELWNSVYHYGIDKALLDVRTGDYFHDNAQYQQLIGRIYREGQQKNVEVVIIRGTMTRKDRQGKIHRFPYDPELKWRRIVDKKTLADCAVDGIYPEHNFMSVNQAIKEAIKWIERLERGEVSTIERKDLDVELTAEEREERIRVIGDLARMNKEINKETSEETFKRVQENPIYLEQFHRNFREAKEEWPIIPVKVIADKIKYIQAPRYMKKLVVGDFGAGEAELSQMLKDNVDKVYSFDRSNILNKDIIECNMIHTKLEDGDLDVGVYSLSLENKDWIKHFAEARRTITDNGYLFIAVTTESLEEGKRLHKLREALKSHKFEIYNDYPQYKFTFLDCRKVNNKFRR